jgi:hypothetical protein
MTLDTEAPANERTLSARALADGAGGWWRSPFSVFQTNLQEIDATMDVERVLDAIGGHGSDTWLINTGGIASFYPTDLPFQTRNPFLINRPSGDLIGDAVEAAHRRGIRVLSRMDFSKVASRIAAEHPEWLFLSPKGERQIYNTLYTACPSADYYQDRSLDILDEVIDRYPVDGFFFNWFNFSERDYSRVYHGVCHCAKCTKAFAEFSGGKPLPDDPKSPTYPEWLQFSSGVIRALTTKISNHIHEKAPDAALVLGRGAPVIYFEANNAFGRELWHHNTSENVSAHMTGLPEISLMVNSVSFVDMPYRMAGEQPEHFAQYLIQAIARGGNPSTYIMGAPGRIPYANLPMAKEVTQFHKRHRDLYAGLRPGSTIAVARPNRLRSASAGYAESVSEFRGLYTSLQETHLPFDVIDAGLIAKMAAEGNLDRYALVILPDLGALGRDAAAALDAFVSDGGTVVLTGTSGVGEDGSVEMATAPSLMRFGATVGGDDLWATYVAGRTQVEMGGYSYAPSVVPVYGGYTRFVWKPGVEKLDMVLPQAPFGPPEKCYGHAGSDDPGIARLATGKGSVVHIPWSVGYTYWEFGTTEVRDYFLRTIAGLTGHVVSGEMPEQVEMIVGRDEAGLVVHVINQTGARRKSFGPHVPVIGAKLRVQGSIGPVELLVSDAAATVGRDGDATMIELPPLGLFEVVRIPLA